MSRYKKERDKKVSIKGRLIDGEISRNQAITEIKNKLRRKAELEFINQNKNNNSNLEK